MRNILASSMAIIGLLTGCGSEGALPEARAKELADVELASSCKDVYKGDCERVIYIK